MPQNPIPEDVAHGNRRDEMRYEDDPDQLVRIRHTFPVEGPLPPDEHVGALDEDRPAPDLPTDAVEPRPSPSVWDARPPDGSA